MTADGFNPFHPVGIGTDRQRQPLDFHMHQLAAFGDFIRIICFVPLTQNAFSASGHEKGKPLDHFLLEFHVRRDRAPITDALGNFRLDQPLRGFASHIRPRHNRRFAESVHFDNVGNGLCLACLYDVASDGNAGDEQTEEGDHTPLRGTVDIRSVAFKPLFASVQVGASPFFPHG